MKDFESWFADLCSNHNWMGPASMHHKPETFKSLCNKVYMDYLAGNGVKSMEDCRRHVYNLVCKTPGDNKKVEWWKPKEESKEVKEEWKPLTGEERQKKLAEFKAMIDSTAMVNAVPKLTVKQIIDEGQWRSVSTINPKSDVEKAIILEEHLEKLNTARRKVFLSAYPDASEEEIQAYLDKFKTL